MDPKKFVLIHHDGTLSSSGLSAVTGIAADKEVDSADSWGKITWRRFCQNKAAVYSLVIFLIIICIAILAPVISPFDPAQSVGAFDEAPSAGHLLGTDDVGRDVLSRLIYGSQVSLIVGVGSVVIYAVVGITLGLLSGYFGGAIDSLIMRITEVFMSYPQFMIILVIVSLIGPNMMTVMLVMGFMGWPPICRLVRGEVLRVKSLDYVAAAVVTGYSPLSIVFKHILPNVLSPILVNCTFGIAQAILIEASLSFLGMGVQPPASSWGNMLTSAQSIMILSEEPWRWIPPGVAILVAVLTINFLGDGLNEAINGDSK
ncbi:ABC transporter permease [Megasphaera cerevisiae]|uniref:ABC transporter permease n=1 Tax=Megasphaera cerevisiae TaxID=39029 RepID=UPI00069E444B|nr:ABC transporter permease [Megasphaera cerevisiae]SJZ89834.1 peptide/nickel transport system permease protein [Megasphaera cerevisiae DSM 20462]